MLKHRFGRFLEPDRLHFAAHSHHLWPDVTLDAQQQHWLDAAELVDDKWGPILEELLAGVQRQIAPHLGLSDPATLAFAPNTHEFVVRLGSCLEPPFRIVTTDSEFHSFRRQAARWEEAGIVTALRVPVEPFASFPDRFAGAIVDEAPDLVYFSHVFYNSGFAVPDLTELVHAVPGEDAFVVVDGYHGFMALPTDLAQVESRVFYLAGGYKYAMSGSGACFMHCPPGYAPRPVDTGWYAGFGDLADTAPEVGYAADGSRFFGATFDATPFHRMHAVMTMLADEGVSVADIHAHVRRLQAGFMAGIADGACPFATEDLLPEWDEADRGHFLTFRIDHASRVYAALHERGVITDHRDDRLRFGFGVYHDEDDVDRLLQVLQQI